MKIFNKYGCLTCSLALISIILCIAYVYYGIIIKIRDFPEDGDVSLSGCYVTQLYLIDWDDSTLLNWVYRYPAFVKVFDLRTKSCVYTSNIYDLDFLTPLTLIPNASRYGMLVIDTKCNGKFIPPN